eukprot:TRINITY_DN35781_c0_g1_i2.p1 TRINITY_DN35781_c0_g1~~TRINITY_DN35781_c0_g1_i2.p1  ORF type:complete len:289 (+),score=26.64 TRINITY_DN35781_c0_g1_i2:179-1045(+)
MMTPCCGCDGGCRSNFLPTDCSTDLSSLAYHCRQVIFENQSLKIYRDTPCDSLYTILDAAGCDVWIDFGGEVKVTGLATSGGGPQFQFLYSQTKGRDWPSQEWVQEGVYEPQEGAPHRLINGGITARHIRFRWKGRKGLSHHQGQGLDNNTAFINLLDELSGSNVSRLGNTTHVRVSLMGCASSNSSGLSAGESQTAVILLMENVFIILLVGSCIGFCVLLALVGFGFGPRSARLQEIIRFLRSRFFNDASSSDGCPGSSEVCLREFQNLEENSEAENSRSYAELADG